MMCLAVVHILLQPSFHVTVNIGIYCTELSLYLVASVNAMFYMFGFNDIFNLHKKGICRLLLLFTARANTVYIMGGGGMFEFIRNKVYLLVKK